MKRVRADHPPRDLAGDRHERDAVEERVGEPADQVGGAGPRRGDTDAGFAGGASVSLGGEDAALFVAGEDVADDVGAREGLVNLHRRAARVGEDVGDALALEGFDEDVGAFARLVRGKSGRKVCFWRCYYSLGDSGQGGGGGFGEGACDDAETGFSELMRKRKGEFGNWK